MSGLPDFRVDSDAEDSAFTMSSLIPIRSILMEKWEDDI